MRSIRSIGCCQRRLKAEQVATTTAQFSRGADSCIHRRCTALAESGVLPPMQALWGRCRRSTVAARLVDPWNGGEAIGPPVFVERVVINQEAVRLVTKAGQRSCTDNPLLSLVLCGVGPEDLQVVTVLFVPFQRALFVAVASRSSVTKGGVPHVPQQVDVHALKVRGFIRRGAINRSKIGFALMPQVLRAVGSEVVTLRGVEPVRCPAASMPCAC